MTVLQDELTAAGFTPQIAFKNDGYAKVLYLKNSQNQDIRLTISNGAYNPTVKLAHQNLTFKRISSGTMRVHLKQTG